MNKTRKRSLLSFLLCAVLIAAMALSMMGCNEQLKERPNTNHDDSAAGNATIVTTPPTASGDNNKNELGQGATTFTFTVTDKAGTSTTFTIHTDKATVGEALLEHNLIVGEEGADGLYVKTVNGITADYDVDKTYWAFYINGEYASTGVDKTAVTNGATYAFKVES